MFKGISSISAPTGFKRHTSYYPNRELTYSSHIPAYRSPRIVINVSGMRYETYEETLSNYPETLLGCPVRRKEYFNPSTNEYVFLRDKHSFNAILFYYQSRGILSKPDDVSEVLFSKELEFYGIIPPWEQANHEENNMEESQDIALPPNCLKRTLWLWFEYPRSSNVARGLALWSVFVIVVSTIAFCVETLPALKIRKQFSTTVKNIVFNNISREDISGQWNVTERFQSDQSAQSHDVVDHWFIIEATSVVWFTVEYLVRLYSAPCFIKFVRSPMGIMDIVAIMPFYFTLTITLNPFEVQSFAVLLALRLFRVLRIFKLSRYSSALGLLVKTLYASSDQLKSLCFCFLVGVILFSSAIFYAEDDVTTYPSIPHAFWWTIITMTSVGYGDVVPVSIAGRLVGSLCAMCGLILFCLPTPVLVSNFIKYYLNDGITKDQKKKQFADNLKALFLRNSKQ
ncbi:potassium voltage-gated channel subfamily A member 3-like [Exaiptasia diaphana]|uniref:Potassium channel n=1 Tax=Exaiptasia diaphana TaxID=2652724 RepID=A0A913WX85_EXADI|nr:potassium voltage-gated channel subfamily A member 3-like [Exaiptasia diaphana]